jgi:hypothetical protein
MMGSVVTWLDRQYRALSERIEDAIVDGRDAAFTTDLAFRLEEVRILRSTMARLLLDYEAECVPPAGGQVDGGQEEEDGP